MKNNMLKLRSQNQVLVAQIFFHGKRALVELANNLLGIRARHEE